MSVREIQGHLQQLYGLNVSLDLISTITDDVLEEVEQWQQRRLESMYPIVYFDALRLKIRDEGTVKNKAVYLALGVRADGKKEVLGLWIEQTEGAKFWLKVFNELKNRGLDDVLIAVVDGLRGFPEAIEAVYPQAQIQTCIVHLIRNSLNLASWKDRKLLAARSSRSIKRHRRCGSGGAAGVCRERMGPKIPDGGGDVAAPVGTGYPVLRLPARSPENHLHDQCHREHAHAAAENRQESRSLPDRRSCQQTAVPSLAQYRERLEDGACHVETGSQSIRHSVRRAIHECPALKLSKPTSAHRIPDTSPRPSQAILLQD
jgi:hypothetical protein